MPAAVADPAEASVGAAVVAVSGVARKRLTAECLQVLKIRIRRAMERLGGSKAAVLAVVRAPAFVRMISAVAARPLARVAVQRL